MPGETTVRFSHALRRGDFWDTHEGTKVYVEGQGYDVIKTNKKANAETGEEERYSIERELGNAGPRAVWEALPEHGEAVKKILKFAGPKKQERGLASIEIFPGSKKRVTVVPFWAVIVRQALRDLTPEERADLALAEDADEAWADMLRPKLQKLSDDEQLQQRICQDFLSVTDLDKVKDPAKLSLIQSTVFTFFGATLEFGMTVFPGLRRSFKESEAARQNTDKSKRSKSKKRTAMLADKEVQTAEDEELLPFKERLHDDADRAERKAKVAWDQAKQSLQPDEVAEVMRRLHLDPDIAAAWPASDASCSIGDEAEAAAEAAGSFATGKEPLTSLGGQQLTNVPAACATAKPRVQGAAGPLRKAQALQHLPVPPINMLQPAQAASAPPASACAPLPGAQQLVSKADGKPAGKPAGVKQDKPAAKKSSASGKRKQVPGQQTLLGAFSKKPAL